MGRQAGVIKFTGQIGDLSFYKSKSEGFLVRKKSVLDAERVSRDPAFVRTRENASEFGNAVSAGALLRRALRQVLPFAHDGKLNARMNQAMMQVKNWDTRSRRGDRRPAEGFLHPEGRELLRGFEFNARASLGQILLHPLHPDPDAGTIAISDFQPASHIHWPDGATHCVLTGILTVVNFAGEIPPVTRFSEAASFSRTDDEQQDLSLVTEIFSDQSGVAIQLFLLQFEQELNGVSYSLYGNWYNALTIVSVSAL